MYVASFLKKQITIVNVGGKPIRKTASEIGGDVLVMYDRSALIINVGFFICSGKFR